MTSEPLRNHILYHDDDWSTILLDIPKSIAEAQDFDEHHELLSCPPISEPFQTNEPKTKKARSRVTNFQADQTLHEGIAALASAGLRHMRAVRDGHQGFCLPRKMIEENWVNQPSERKAAELDDQNQERREFDESQTYAASAEQGRPLETTDVQPDLQLIGSDGQTEGFDGAYFNDSDEPELLRLRGQSGSQDFKYRIPPGSLCLQNRCEDVAKFRSAAKQYAAGTGCGKGRFDLIVMDPPWPNLSAKRKKGYKRAASQSDIFTTLVGLDLDIHIAPRGVVAIWITNNPNIRELVLGPGGLFEIWNVGLLEEWIWLKVTSKGDPVTQMEGLWRKPYELLLVGQAAADRYASEPVTAWSGHRRLVVAVPDLHSRKPCLKSLMERIFLPDRAADYASLEIFARHLVKGWMSWGDEALKFNESNQWS